MVRIWRAVAISLMLALGSCADGPGSGLFSIDPPPAKPFVVEQRPAQTKYLNIGETPADRQDRAMTPAEEAAFKNDLRGAICRIPENCKTP